MQQTDTFFTASFRIFFVVCLFCLAGGCGRMSGNSFVPAIPGFEKKGVELLLKKPLKEISGLDYIAADSLVAINDEQGKLFFIDATTGNFNAAKFGAAADYEDVVKLDSFYYVLSSKGAIIKINAFSLTTVAEYPPPVEKHYEFESMYYDASQNGLVLVCKECGKKQDSIEGFLFNLQTRSWQAGVYYTIQWDAIKKLVKDNAIEPKPSAAAINTKTNKLYIIASVGKVLLQCDSRGQLEAVYQLNPDHFLQPEGIAFSPQGDMYICNEGRQAKATLLTFKAK